MGILKVLFGATPPAKDINYSSALSSSMRELDGNGTERRPTWFRRDSTKKDFLNAVVKRTSSSRLPLAYVVHGFVEPLTTGYLYGLAACMERRGATLDQQAMAVAGYLRDQWSIIPYEDRGYFTGEKRMASLAQANINAFILAMALHRS